MAVRGAPLWLTREERRRVAANIDLAKSKGAKGVRLSVVHGVTSHDPLPGRQQESGVPAAVPEGVKFTSQEEGKSKVDDKPVTETVKSQK